MSGALPPGGGTGQTQPHIWMHTRTYTHANIPTQLHRHYPDDTMQPGLCQPPPEMSATVLSLSTDWWAKFYGRGGLEAIIHLGLGNFHKINATTVWHTVPACLTVAEESHPRFNWRFLCSLCRQQALFHVLAAYSVYNTVSLSVCISVCCIIVEESCVHWLKNCVTVA